mmetsp:Transcript_7485/g.18351  ORF Transcript_7485/g.18351 Transcript_7485/m.18351 type:complete len:124 (-) Transcript_7485:801-1172(-)
MKHSLSDEDKVGAQGVLHSDEVEQLHLIRGVGELPCHDVLDNRSLQALLVRVHATKTSNRRDHHIMKTAVADLLVHGHKYDVDDEHDGARDEEEYVAVPMPKAVDTSFLAALIRTVGMMDGEH